MYVLVSVMILIICVLLVLVVLVQNSKGGGLAANFASSNQFMGVRKTADFLEKATWTLAVLLLVLSLLSVFIIPPQGRVQTSDTELREKLESGAGAQPVQDYQAPPSQNQGQQAQPQQAQPQKTQPQQSQPKPAQQQPAQKAPAQQAPAQPQPVPSK